MPILSTSSELDIVSACGLFVDVAEEEMSSARLFPVPVRSGAALHVELSGVRNNATYDVLDPLGGIIMQGSGGPGPLLTIPTQGLVAGAYMLRVTAGDHASTAQRFVVE
ncbi:MAG: T9SS type A sorting domain-containing protein [Flavobacteriales bacterium]|nr:T9SS type A sorting domain-containing protein [Flavobacteriales bacterium]